MTSRTWHLIVIGILTTIAILGSNATQYRSREGERFAHAHIQATCTTVRNYFPTRYRRKDREK